MGHQHSPAGQAVLDSTIQGRLGARLRAAYERFTRSPLPDQHVELLLALRHKERELKRRSQNSD